MDSVGNDVGAQKQAARHREVPGRLQNVFDYSTRNV